MRTSIYIVLAFIVLAALSSSVIDNVQQLNSLLKNKEWNAMRQDEFMLDSHISQVLPNSHGETTSIYALLYDGNDNRIYITERNFNEKLPNIFILLNLCYVKLLKDSIKTYLYYWNLCETENSDYGRVQFKRAFSNFSLVLRRMLSSLKYIYNLRNTGFGVEEMVLKNAVYNAIYSILGFIDAVEFPINDMIKILTKNLQELLHFINRHITPPPEYVLNPKIIPDYITNVVESFDSDDDIQEKIHVLYVSITQLMKFYAKKIEDFGFRFDEDERVSIV